MEKEFDANSLRRASNSAFALGVLFLLLGVATLVEYRSTGAVRDHKHDITLEGRGALTQPIAFLGGGACLLGFGIRFRRNRRGVAT